VIFRPRRAGVSVMHEIPSGSLWGLNIFFGKKIVIEIVHLIALSQSFALRGSKFLHHLCRYLFAHLILIGYRGLLGFRIVSTLK